MKQEEILTKFFIIACEKMLVVCPPDEPGWLRRTELTEVCGEELHRMLCTWRAQGLSGSSRGGGVRQGHSSQWQSGLEALLGLLCQSVWSFPVLNLVKSGNARYCCVVTARKFLLFEIMSTKCAAT